MEFLVIAELLVVLTMIFIGARVGGIGLGIYGMIGVFVLVFGFGLEPGSAPIDVMMIIVAVITAAAALQASGGLEYLVGVAAKFLRKHPGQITYFGPLTCWLFCIVAGTAHTSYSLLPIISEIAQANKIRPERPMSLSAVAASLGITGSPVSAATAALVSQDILGAKGIELGTILIVCIPASLVAILVAAFIQNRVGKELEDDPEYKRRVTEGIINPEEDKHNLEIAEEQPNPRAKYSVWTFFAGVILVVIFGFFPQLRPEGVTMSQAIEMIMMSIAALILFVGKAKASDAVHGNLFKAGMKMSSVVPSTMGTLMASGIMEAGKSLNEKDKIEAADLAVFFESFAAGIKKRGKCEAGDRTIYDALFPAGKEAKKVSDGSILEVAMAALQGAEAGVEATKDMLPKFGKAAVFASKAKGVADQGAVAGYLMVKGVYLFLESKSG